MTAPTSQYLANTVSLSCTASTGTEPITLAEAKLYLRVDTDDDDNLISAMITGARAAAEGRTHRVLTQTTWQWVASEIKGTVQVPLTPCTACTDIKVNGESVDPALYVFVPGGIGAPLFAQITALDGFPEGAATVTLTCGYAQVPEDIRRWIYVRLGDAYEQRESFAVGSNFHEFSREFIDSLLDPYLIPNC